MSDNASESKKPQEQPTEESALAPLGPIASALAKSNLAIESLGQDHEEVEIIKVDRDDFIATAKALYEQGFNYLQCQAGYDAGPGQDLVSTYHLAKVSDGVVKPEEVRVKVFLPREDPRIESVYWLWKTADWQERETYDMYGIVYEGHPNLTRILMPEDWVGWPMRKDYISPDFYELQDAY